MRSLLHTAVALPLLGCALALVHCSNPESSEAGDEPAAATQDLVSGRDALCKDFQGEVPRAFCDTGKRELVTCLPAGQRGGPGPDAPARAGAVWPCDEGCTNAGLPHCMSTSEVEETKFCVGKVGDLFPTLHCLKTAGRRDRLVQCIPGSQRGYPHDPGDSARSIECISGCTMTSAGVASCNGSPP